MEQQIERLVVAGRNSRGQGMIVVSARGIIASDNPRGEVHKLHNLINHYR